MNTNEEAIYEKKDFMFYMCSKSGGKLKQSGCCVQSEVKMMNCEECAYYQYDEGDGTYYCTVDMDEDDYARLFGGHLKSCHYYRNGDEYAIVRHQM